MALRGRKFSSSFYTFFPMFSLPEPVTSPKFWNKIKGST